MGDSEASNPNQRGGWFYRLTSHAAFTGVTTLLIVLAGAAASLFTKGIRSTYVGFPAEDSSAGTLIFWGLVIAAVVLLVINQRGLFHKGDEAHGELKGALTQLQSAQKQLDDAVKRLNTLPSENFLPSYKELYVQALATTTMVLIDSLATVANVETAIRAVLTALIDTAKDYDNAETSTVYSANVMLFRLKGVPSVVPGIVDLVPVGSNSPEYDGVLELVPELSTASGSKGEMDWTTSAISLPVPSDASDYLEPGTETMQSSVLPGAPTSFVKGSFDAFSSLTVLLLRLRATSVDRKQVDKIRAYFRGPGSHIQSFASLPIFPLTSPTSPSDVGDVNGQNGLLLGRRPLGVLNLQSNRPGMLADNGVQLFSPLMSTFAALVAILVVQRRELALTGGNASNAVESKSVG